jgi:hypothetical protein
VIIVAKTIHSGNLTFIDLTDSKKVDVHISSNLPTTQIYDVNLSKCSPDWTNTPLTLKFVAYADSTDITSNLTNDDIKWYRQIGTADATVIQNGGTTLQVATNDLIDKGIGWSAGVISYVCRITYNNKTFENKITFARTDSGRDGTSVNILGKYNTLTELQEAHPVGNAGDAYVINGHLYAWTADDLIWEDVGNIQGPAGEAAKSIIITGTSQVFQVGSSAITPAEITITAKTVNFTGDIDWSYRTNNDNDFTATAPNGVRVVNNKKLTITGKNLGDDITFVTCKATYGEVEDVFTVYKAIRGEKGDAASMAFLTNENMSFAANASGIVTALPTTTNVVAYNGTIKQMPELGEISDIPEGMLIAEEDDIVLNEKRLAISFASSADLGSSASTSGTITIPIISPVVTNLKLSWSKINAGAKGDQGNKGSDAYTVMLTNESHVFAGDVNHAYADSVETQIFGYKGATQQSVTIVSVDGKTASTIDTATSIEGLKFKCSTLSGTSPIITFTCTESFINANGTIPIVISVGGISFTRMFSYSIAFKGATGDVGSTGPTGAPATAYWLISSASAVQKTSTGTITVTPSTLTFTGKSKTGANTPTDYACRWIIAYSTDGTNYTNLYTSTANEASKSITVTTIYKTIRARMYLAGGTATLLDEQIIPVISDGVKGDKGNQGDRGAGISSVTVTYGVSTDASTQPTSWQQTLPTVAEGSYLWTRTVTDYTDTSIADTVTLTYAKQGAKGSAGSAGTSVTVSSIQYQAGTSATTAPTGTWSNNVVTVAEGSYLWTKTTFSDGKVAYGVAKQGAKGSQGVAGTPAITFQIYSQNGYLLTKETPSLTLQTFAYEGSAAITSGATYQWSQLIDDTWTDITDATSTSYTATQADVLKAKSYRCVMTYKSQTYTSTVTVQDKTDTYNSIMCISSNATNNDCYWVLYTLVYSDSEEVDPLLGPISVNAPTSPKSGDYWYAVDAANATVTLKKHNGTSWANSTDTQSLSYYWDIINEGSAQVPLGASSKVKVVSCHDFTATATLVCEVSNVEDGLLTQSSLSLTDASDPIVSTTEPTATVDGQIWIKPNSNGTYLMFVWDEATNNWISSDMDTRNKVYTSRPSSYNVGDLWITASDTDHGSYLHGTLLQAQKSNTTYNGADWSPTLRYDQDIDDMKNTLNNLSQYVTITSAGLRIGARGTSGELSPFTSLFTSTELSFYQNSEKLLTLANNQLTAPRIVVEDDLEVQGSISLGDLKIIIENNGSFSFAVSK